VCECLATCLCINYTCCTKAGGGKDANDSDAVEPISAKSAMANEAGTHHQTYLLSPAAEAEAAARRQLFGETERLLADIRDLLRTTVRDMERLRRDKDEIERKANDWMIAAAVIDRICCILITFFFIAGTIALVALLFVSPAE